MRGWGDLRGFIKELRATGEIIDIHHPVDPTLELAEVHRRVAAADGPALFFHNVQGSDFPVVTNLFGSARRLELAFPGDPQKLVQDLVDLLTRDFPPTCRKLWERRHLLKRLVKLGNRLRKRAPILSAARRPPDLERLPLLKLWPEDGGHFVTLPLVYTENPETGPPNLGIYRMQRYDAQTTGMHWQIAKGGGFHHAQAEALGIPLPTTVFLGGPPALLMSAIAPLPENVPETLLASLLLGDKLDTVSVPETTHPVLGQCEFALVGEVPLHERHPEGPFGDHYGYYSLTHPFPVFRCKAIYHRKGAIYPATVVGKPRQEDYYIGNLLQNLLSPLFPVVMPGVRAIWSYGETGFHSLTAAVVRERYGREGMASAFRILGEGQLSLTKFLLLTDQPVDLTDFPTTLTTVLERFRPETDLYVFANLSMDTLDYTGPALNKGSRGVLAGLGTPHRKLPETFNASLPRPLREVKAYCPGCLVVSGPTVEKECDLAGLAGTETLKGWPLIILVDNVDEATRSDSAFLWTTFTRFEPAADIHSPCARVHRNHICYSGPILIDARMKPSYPKAVATDPKTQRLVTDNWLNYFPQQLEMGDSEQAHVG